MGLHPTQIKVRKKQLGPEPVITVTGQGRSPTPTSDEIPANGTKSPNMDKAKFCNENYTSAPAYNKGPYMVVGRNEITSIGRK